MPSKILVTGAAGFIGYHVSKALAESHTVIGIDNYSDYYNPDLKRDRVSILTNESNFSFIKMDIVDRQKLSALFKMERFDIIVHLAAQAGVRHSIENPRPYIDTNIVGTFNILEGCRYNSNLKHLVYASSSSVYGRSAKTPFSEEDLVREPSSLYAASKRSVELMVESYNHLYKLPCTGLRFFTVYGPWGRPDMAYYKFTELLYNNQPIPLYNRGKHERAMTYISDIVDGVKTVAESQPESHKIYNLGHYKTVDLLTLVNTLGSLTKKEINLEYLPFQSGDVLKTSANINLAGKDFGYSPKVDFRKGLENFVDWYKWYHKIT